MDSPGPKQAPRSTGLCDQEAPARARVGAGLSLHEHHRSLGSGGLQQDEGSGVGSICEHADGHDPRDGDWRDDRT